MARNPYSASGALVAPTPRMAGATVEANPQGWGEMLASIFSGGGTQAKDAVKGVTQGAGNAAKGAAQGAKGMNTALAGNLLKNSGRLAAGTGALALIGAATEFADPDDPVLRNAAQAAGNGVGTLGGVAAGATIGTAVLPGLGTVIGGLGGGFFGSQAGSGIAGGIYDLMANETPQERARKNMIKDAATRRQIAVEDATARLPIVADMMDIKRADAFERAERELKIQNEYNFANSINQAMLNAQQQATMEDIAMTQFMMN